MGRYCLSEDIRLFFFQKVLSNSIKCYCSAILLTLYWILFTNLAIGQEILIISKTPGSIKKLHPAESIMHSINDSMEYKSQEFKIQAKIKKRPFVIERKDGYIQQTTIINSPKVILPELVQYTHRRDDQCYIIFDSLKIMFDMAKVKAKYYSSINDFLNNKAIGKNYSTNLIEDKTAYMISLSRRIYTIITSFGFTDLNSSLQESIGYNNVFLDITINDAIYKIKPNYGGTAEIEITYCLKNDLNESCFYSKTITSKSILLSTDGYYYKTDLLENAIINSFVSFMDMDETQSWIKSKEIELSERLASQNEITLNKDGNYCNNIQEAVTAVVTIINGSSHCSGCCISNDGYIVTNYSFIKKCEGNPIVQMSNGIKTNCSIVRYNEKYDLALIKIDTQNIKSLKFISEIPEPGEIVYSIGTSAKLELGQTLSKGVISGKRISSGIELIQTDASVNLGCNGGALINTKGELLGIINNSWNVLGFEGIAFVTPSKYFERALKLK